jgi:hypothetical protein
MAGAIVLVGQLIGGIISLTIVQSAGTGTIFGAPPASGSTDQLVYYASGLGVGLCIGLFGVALAALGGAAGGYVGTSSEAAAG